MKLLHSPNNNDERFKRANCFKQTKLKQIKKKALKLYEHNEENIKK